MNSPLLENIERFSDPQDEAELKSLDTTVQTIDPGTCGPREIQALFGVFERFPEHDGFGVFWGILHALETCQGYESELVASVQRQPCEFNVLMINRLLNAGVVVINGHQLVGVLKQVLADKKSTCQALHDAQSYLRIQGLEST